MTYLSSLGLSCAAIQQVATMVEHAVPESFWVCCQSIKGHPPQTVPVLLVILVK